MYRTRIPIALAMLVVAAGASAQDADPRSGTRRVLEKTPGAQLQGKVAELFKGATSITLKYSDISEVEWPYYTKDQISRRPHYTLTRSCSAPSGCDRMMTPIRERLASGLRLDGPCPAPFVIVVEFAKPERAVASVHVNGTGQCFSIGDESYFVKPEMSFIPLMERVFAALN